MARAGSWTKKSGSFTLTVAESGDGFWFYKITGKRSGDLAYSEGFGTRDDAIGSCKDRLQGLRRENAQRKSKKKG